MKNFTIECNDCGNEWLEDFFIDWDENSLFIKCNICGSEETLK